MTASARALVLALACVLGVALATPALAAYSPKLIVTVTTGPAGGVSSVSLNVTAGADADPTARATFLTPPAWTATFAQPAGTQIGTVSAQVIATQLGDNLITATGTLVTANPSDFAGPATQCTGSAAHTAVWLLRLTAGTTQLQPIPAYVDSLVGVSPVASAQVIFCLPPPPAATFGIKLNSATLTLSGIFLPGAGAGNDRWTALLTPYAANNAANPLGTVETQSITRVPNSLSLRANRVA